MLDLSSRKKKETEAKGCLRVKFVFDLTVVKSGRSRSLKKNSCDLCVHVKCSSCSSLSEREVDTKANHYKSTKIVLSCSPELMQFQGRQERKIK